MCSCAWILSLIHACIHAVTHAYSHTLQDSNTGCCQELRHCISVWIVSECTIILCMYNIIIMYMLLLLYLNFSHTHWCKCHPYMPCPENLSRILSSTVFYHYIFILWQAAAHGGERSDWPGQEMMGHVSRGVDPSPYHLVYMKYCVLFLAFIIEFYNNMMVL